MTTTAAAREMPAATSASRRARRRTPRVSPASGRLAHALGIEVERDVAHAFGVEQARQALAVAAVAADDHVALGARSTARRCGAAAASAASSPSATRAARCGRCAAIRNGVASIDSTIAASSGCRIASGTMPARAGERQQHEAELAAPARARAPVRSAVPGGAPKARASAAISANLRRPAATKSSEHQPELRRDQRAGRASCRW